MKVMILMKGNQDSEASKMPPAEALVAMGKYNEELIAAGKMVGGEGLHPTSSGVRIKNVGGKKRVTDGPFTETKEIVAGYWVLEVKSKAEAVELAKKIPFGGDDGEVEVRPLFEVTDFPVQENESGWREKEIEERAKSPDLLSLSPRKQGTKRFIMMVRANAEYEAGAMPDEAMLTGMGNVNTAMIEKGVMMGGEGLKPSKDGAKVRFTKGKPTVIDGPFAEAKELIAGFSVLQCATKEEAIEWVWRCVQVMGDGGECEVRPIAEEEDFSPELRVQVPEVFEAERAFRERAGQ